MAMGKTRKELVVTITASDGSCSAAPMDMLVNIGDSITFQNLTDNPVVIFFPNEDLFGQSVLELAPHQDATLTVASVREGDYSYTVYCKGKREFDSKASKPRIIVYREIS
jgi:hypothetical protein